MTSLTDMFSPFLPPSEFEQFGYYARQIPPHLMDSNKDVIMLPVAPAYHQAWLQDDDDLILAYEMPLNTPPAGCCCSTASQPPSPPEIKRQKEFHRMISYDDEMTMVSPTGDNDDQLPSANVKKLKEQLALAKMKANGTEMENTLKFYQDKLSVDAYGIVSKSICSSYQVRTCINSKVGFRQCYSYEE